MVQAGLSYGVVNELARSGPGDERGRHECMGTRAKGSGPEDEREGTSAWGLGPRDRGQETREGGMSAWGLVVETNMTKNTCPRT